MDVPTFAQRYSAKFLARPIAAVLTVIAVLNGLAWLANVVPAVFNTSMPAFLAGTGLTTNPVYVQDLSFWIPLMLVSSVWLWHRRPWGFVNAGALLVFGFIESISIAVDQWMGSVADPSSPVSSASLTPIFGGVAAAMLIPLFLYFRDLGPAVNGKAIARGALVLVDGFAAISALFGGLELETGWPSRFPTTMLQGTPFSDFVVPGLILGLMVGGTATIATVETVRSVSGGAAWSFMAGCIMAGWITGEVLLLDILGNTGHGVSAYFWLQPFYFGVGVVMVVLAVILAPDGWRGIARTTHMTRLSNWR